MSEDNTPVCSVCAGAPFPIGRPCICEGEGTIYAENTGLRKEIYRLTKQVEILKSHMIEDLKEILKGEW